MSLSYQAYHCSAMLLCSPVSVSLYLHLLAFSNLLFFSTRVPQPSFTVSLSCCTQTCAFCSSAFYALCAMSIQCTIPLLCISASAHCLLLHAWITLNIITHLFFVLHSYSLCAPCASYMRNPFTCSTHRHCFSHRYVHSTPHCHHFTPSSPNTLSLFHMFSSCRVLFLIIIAIP